MAALPVVAIVGRPNVGKSSLLNALVGKRISIVQDLPGVTRDRVSTPLALNGKYLELMDTGGYGFDDPDQLGDQIKQQIEMAVRQAQLVLFVVDCQDGLTSADELIAAMLRKHSVKTLLLANKADGPRADTSLGEFARLGLGTPLGISALHDRNLEAALDAIAAAVDLTQAPSTIPEPQMLLAIVGKRNAGKSTLVNAIARHYEQDDQRVIVSEIPGTTRDSVDVRFEKDDKTLVVIDTAGVRKKRMMVSSDIEFYSFHRAQRSIRRADVVALLVDGTEPLSDPDRKLAQYVNEQYKPVVLVVNKWDLTRQTIQQVRALETGELENQKLQEEYIEYLRKELPHVHYAPIVFATARDGRNIQAVLDTAQQLRKQAELRLTTAKLNDAMKQILGERSPSTPSGRRAKVYYATQIEAAPPTIVLFVNNPKYFDDAYQRFILNRFRMLLPYSQVPIKLLFRGKDPQSRRGGGAKSHTSDPASPPTHDLGEL